jgi:hypothetical protein
MASRLKPVPQGVRGVLFSGTGFSREGASSGGRYLVDFDRSSLATVVSALMNMRNMSFLRSVLKKD